MWSVFLCRWWDNTVSFHRIATTRSNGTVFQSVFLFCNCTVMFCNIIVPCWFCCLLSRDDRVQTMLLNKTKKKSRILRRSWIFPFDFKVRNSHDLQLKNNDRNKTYAFGSCFWQGCCRWP
jgi:hypothetical protein